ncbi:porin [Pokkaliibacter sp. CJK22405]|uniref:porin n=1 Tax=Pokkaliibacter sp. CJK22405 TaxID=3384615 RepID=UPI00398511D1
MKKSLLAIAIASASILPVVANADATLYGRLHFRVNFDDGKDASINNAGHRLGVKGESELDSGLTAFYQLETEYHNDRDGQSSATSGAADANLAVRHANAGVKGDFGKVTIGRFENPMYRTIVGDVFERTSAAFTQTQERIGSALSYETPSFAGLNAYATVVAAGEGDSSDYKDVDAYSAGLNYENNGFYAGIGYWQAEFTEDQTNHDKQDLSVGVSYNFNNIYVAGNYEHNEESLTDDGGIDVWDVAASYTIDKTRFGINYSEADPDQGSKMTRGMVGVYHDLGGGADVYAEYANVNGAAEDGNDAWGIDGLSDSVTLGYRVKF